MTRLWYRTALTTTLALALIPLSVSAQRVTRRIFVCAVDATGASVLNLTAADLQVTEDGSKREVTRVALGDPGRLATDHEKMMDRYEVEFTGDAKLLQPVVAVDTTREGVKLQMSQYRPF